MGDDARREVEDDAGWNGAGGRAWVALQEVMDRFFLPFERLLVASVRAAGAQHVLDIGCGTGATTLAIARELGAEGSCTGVDVSAPMLARARERAATAGIDAAFVDADAQRYAFPPATFDAFTSRFGVMFFDDPPAAFANLRSAATERAGLHLVAWRGPDENAFMTVAARAAASVVPIAPPDPDAPGQFAWADPARVHAILTDAGWSGVELEPLDLELRFPAAHLADYVTQLGPTGRALAGADAATRARVLDAVIPAFDEYRDGADLRWPAACWMVRGHA